jgi:hypothetical protein
MTAGQVTVPQKPGSIPDQTLRLYSICAGAGAFLLLCLYESYQRAVNRHY